MRAQISIFFARALYKFKRAGDHVSPKIELRYIVSLILVPLARESKPSRVGKGGSMLRTRSLAAVLSVVLLSGWALAQGGATGAISGTVQDASGAVLSAAQVVITSEATGQVVRTL